MKTTTEKICSLSKAISIALTISFIFMVVATAAVAILLSALALTDANTKLSLHVAIISLRPASSSYLGLVWLLINVLVCLLLFAAMLLVLRNIFRDISRDGIPFNKTHTLRIKTVAVLGVIYALANTLLEYAGSRFISDESMWFIDFAGILFSILIYGVALIYDYGCDLQQQSDETL